MTAALRTPERGTDDQGSFLKPRDFAEEPAVHPNFSKT